MALKFNLNPTEVFFNGHLILAEVRLNRDDLASAKSHFKSASKWFYEMHTNGFGDFAPQKVSEYMDRFSTLREKIGCDEINSAYDEFSNISTK